MSSEIVSICPDGTDHYNVAFGPGKWDYHVRNAIDCISDWIRYTKRSGTISYKSGIVVITGTPQQRVVIKKRLDFYDQVNVYYDAAWAEKVEK